jgi:indolepyruvate ferredoxin oxidoreductase
VHAGANITFKILFNDAVAMTGGQPVEGQLSVAEITRQLAAERVRRIVVVSDQRDKYDRSAGFASGVTLHHRDELLKLQRELREVPGVTAIIYDQTCAAEKRRRRKRGRMVDPPRRAFINERVCEGCGDCSVQSNCISIEPVETDFGRKRRINQSSCNKDFSCVNGFCPSFVVVEGATPRRGQKEPLDAAIIDSLPEPGTASIDRSYSILVTGIGGTGVLTVGALIGMAAHLEGKGASVFDMTGLAQKGGAVMSHLRITPNADRLPAPCIGLREAHVVLGCDLAVAAGVEALRSIDSERTRVLLNTRMAPVAGFQLNPDIVFHEEGLVERVASATDRERLRRVDASGAVERTLGDTIATNVFMLGYALQAGLLPVSRAAVEEAVRLNGVAVEFNLKALALGRLAAHDSRRADSADEDVHPETAELDGLVAERMRCLSAYQNDAYAARYRALVQVAREAEERRTPERKGFALAVARYYYKLLAYKDEYEVARLYSDGEFRRALNEQFDGASRIRLLLAPPFLARRHPSTGEPAKREFGSWIFPLLQLLSKLKVLRGTRLDPFGYSAERRTERRLIQEYEELVQRLVAEIVPANHPVAVELASLPERIRGFGHVKVRHMADVERRRRELLAQL